MAYIKQNPIIFFIHIYSLEHKLYSHEIVFHVIKYFLTTSQTKQGKLMLGLENTKNQCF